MSVTIFASLTKSIIGTVSSLLLRPNYLNIFIITGIFKPSDLHFIHLSLNLHSFWSLLYPVIAFEAQLLLSKSILLTKPIFFHSLTSNSLPLHLYLLLSLLHPPLLHCSAPDSLPYSRPSIQRQTDTKEICNKWRCFLNGIHQCVVSTFMDQWLAWLATNLWVWLHVPACSSSPFGLVDRCAPG